MKKDGIILLNKVKGISSFKAINQIKWNIGASKIGHAGTLDPMAEGLMVVMVNSATKFSEDLMKKDKEYYVEMELGEIGLRIFLLIPNILILDILLSHLVYIK